MLQNTCSCISSFCYPMDIVATYQAFLVLAIARVRHINTPLKALSSFLPSLTSSFVGPKNKAESTYGCAASSFSKNVHIQSHVLRPPSPFQKTTVRRHDCSSSPSLDRSQKIYARRACLASSSKTTPSRNDDCSFRLLWNAYEKAQWSMPCAASSSKNREVHCRMTVPSAFSGSFQNHLPQGLCAASFSKIRSDYDYGCLCLCLPWTDSKLLSRTTCAASSSKMCQRTSHDCLLRLS